MRFQNYVSNLGSYFGRVFSMSVVCGLGLHPFSAQAARAPAYDLKLDVAMNGKHIGSPRMTVEDGEKIILWQDTPTGRSFVRLLATREVGDTVSNSKIFSAKNLLVKLEVGTVAADGKKTVHSTPEFLIQQNRKATFQAFTDGADSDKVSLSVLAHQL